MGRDAPRTAVATTDDAFIRVYRRTVGEIYAYLRSRVGERSAAEDLTQEVFIAGQRRAAAGDPVDVAWLLAVARHKLIDHWRARTREERLLVRAHAGAGEPTAHLPDRLDPGRATAALARINPTYRAALVLRHVDGLTVGDVAVELRRSVHATEQVLARARTAFRAAYQEATDD